MAYFVTVIILTALALVYTLDLRKRSLSGYRFKTTVRTTDRHHRRLDRVDESPFQK